RMAVIISPARQQRLVALARAALFAQVRGKAAPRPPDDLDVPVSGAFVTVYAADRLRGCLGYVGRRERLGLAIARLAAEVAYRDVRFDPLRPHELSHVELDLSLLTDPEPVVDVAEIVVGRDGLIVEHGPHRGLLLPQVAVEHGWDRETFLARTCEKAGRGCDAWQ